MNIIESPTLQVPRGDDVPLSVTFTNMQDEAIDISSSTVFFTVKKNLDDADDAALIKVEQTEHDAPSDGKTIIELSNTNTNLPTGNYFYDLQLVRSNGKVSSILYGRFQVVPDITKRTTSNP